MKSKQMDTTKQGVKAYLDAAAVNTGKAYHSGESMRLATLRFILDAAGIEDAEQRAAIGKQFMATPGWFASNASACRQAYESKEGKEKVLTTYVV